MQIFKLYDYKPFSSGLIVTDQQNFVQIIESITSFSRDLDDKLPHLSISLGEKLLIDSIVFDEYIIALTTSLNCVLCRSQAKLSSVLG